MAKRLAEAGRRRIIVAVAYDTELADRLRELVTFEPDVSEQHMFGGLAFLVGGNMAVSVSSRGGLLLRAEPEDAEELLSEPHAEPFVMRGRAMSGWLRVAPEGVETDEQLREWAAVGLNYARSLPPKR